MGGGKQGEIVRGIRLFAPELRNVWLVPDLDSPDAAPVMRGERLHVFHELWDVPVDGLRPVRRIEQHG